MGIAVEDKWAKSQKLPGRTGVFANSHFTCGSEDQGRGLSTDFKDRRAEGRTTSAVMKEQSGKYVKCLH